MMTGMSTIRSENCTLGVLHSVLHGLNGGNRSLHHNGNIDHVVNCTALARNFTSFLNSLDFGHSLLQYNWDIGKSVSELQLRSLDHPLHRSLLLRHIRHVYHLIKILTLLACIQRKFRSIGLEHLAAALSRSVTSSGMSFASFFASRIFLCVGLADRLCRLFDVFQNHYKTVFTSWPLRSHYFLFLLNFLTVTILLILSSSSSAEQNSLVHHLLVS